MASVFSIDTRLAGIISCAICFESKQGRNPKGLHCFDSFCRSCLQGWQDRFHNKNEIDCPVCRCPTKLSGNGINGLADDFKVTELIDLMKSIGDPFVCQGCVSRGLKSRAKVKCVTCDRRLCEECYEFHKSSDMFDDHEIATELCELHGNKVTHVCVTCFLGLCVDCIFSRIHEKHDTCKLAEGLQRLKKCIELEHKTYLDICDSRRTYIEREKGKIEDRAKLQISILKGISALMKQELDSHVSSIENLYILKQKAEVESWSDAEKRKYPLIDIQRTKDEEFGGISKLSVNRMELHQQLQLLNNTHVKTPVTLLYQNVDHSYFTKAGLTKNMNSKICDRYQRAVQKIRGNPVKIWSKCALGVRGLEILEDCSIIVAYDNRDHVVRLDTNGKVMGAYHLTGQGEANKVQRITTHEGNLHILCCDNQSLVTISTESYERHVKKTKNLGSGIYSLAYDSTGACFLASQYRAYGGKVFKSINDNTETTQFSLADGQLRVVNHQGDYKIVVARDSQREVLVYDMHGMLLTTFRECGKRDKFQNPCDVAMLDHEILLVADYRAKRISMFNLTDESFVGHLLSSTDGISRPNSIACKYPYLYVLGSGTLELFKLV